MATPKEPKPALECPFYTVSECAQLDGCSPKTMWKRFKARAIKGQRGGGRGRPYKVLKTAFHKQIGIPE